jgi:hypothetical protein
VENFVETTTSHFARARAFSGIAKKPAKQQSCNLLIIRSLQAFVEGLFCHCPWLHRQGAAFTFAQICSTRDSKEGGFPGLRSKEGVAL